MTEEKKESGAFMKFMQDYRFKMLVPELLVVFGVWYMLPESLTANVYTFLGPLGLIAQPLFFLPSGILAFITAITLHGIYPLDNWHEGKIPDLPKVSIVMIAISFILLPLLVLMQMIGYYITEATEYFSRNPVWERFESFGDLLFYAGAMFFVGLQMWLLIPVFFLAQGVDGIHKIAHHETSNEKITAFFYFLWPVTMLFFFSPIEILAMAAISIPAFAFYGYIRPYYTYVNAVHTATFAIIVVVALLLMPYLPLLNVWFPGFIPPHIPPRLWPGITW